MTPTNTVKKITLSFDNGPDVETTDYVLDILARRGVKASFFVVGQNLNQARAPIERAAQAGHWIGNHTWSHSEPFRNKGDVDFVRSEIERTQDLIGSLAHKRKFFRPFGGGGQLNGVLNQNAVNHLAAGGYTCVLWNSVPGDYKDQDGWTEVAHQQIANIEWPLMVLHDIYPRAMLHLDGFIGGLQDLGYIFEQDFPPDCIAMQQGVATEILGNGIVGN